MIGQEIIDGTRMLLHADENNKAWDESEIILAANVALKNYATQLANSSSQRYYKIASLATVANLNEVALPSDCNGFVDFLKYNKQHLTPKGIRFLIDEPAPGTPNSYTILDNDIFLYPAPSSVLSLYIGYWRKPTSITLANLASEVDFPDTIAPILIFDAAIFCALKHEVYVNDIRKARDDWYDNLQYNKSERIKLTSYQVSESGDLQTAGEQ